MKYIVWDFNGTIIDDASLCLSIENYMLKERNMKTDYSLAWYKDNFCFPVYDYYLKLGYTFTDETYDEMADEFNLLYNQRFHECKLHEGFIETIQKAIDKGYKNIILSASHKENLIRQVDSLGITQYFEELIGIDDYLAGSKTDHAKKWFAQNAIDPRDCILIGDSTHDADTAKALGIEKCYLVSFGHQSHKVLKDYGGLVVDSFEEIEL